MDINLFMVIPLALIWDVFLMKQDQQSKYKIIAGIVFAFFSLLFLITYVIFNKYINIDQLKNKL